MDPLPRAGNQLRSDAWVIRPAEKLDLVPLWGLIHAFAVYERLEHLASGTPEQLGANLFGEAWPKLDCIVAESDGGLCGYAIFYGGYSTFWTRPLLWLEDIYVGESHRGRGLGKALMAEVARVALERGCPRMDWAVLDWNTPAIEFYQRLGATRHGGWHTYRLDAEQMRALVGENPRGRNDRPAG